MRGFSILFITIMAASFAGCKHLSNTISDIALECGQGAIPGRKYVKLLSPNDEPIPGRRLHVYDQNLKVVRNDATSKGCVALGEKDLLALTVEDNAGTWGALVDATMVDSVQKLRKIDDWKPSVSCNSLIRSNGIVANPISWDRTLVHDLPIQIVDSATNNSILSDFRGTNFNLDFLFKDGPLTLKYIWKNPFHEDEAESATCQYVLDRKAPSIETPLDQLKDEFVVEGGSIFTFKIADESAYTFRYCLYAKGEECHLSEAHETSTISTPPSGPWCLRYEAIDSVGNATESKEKCGSSLDLTKMEQIKTNLALASANSAKSPTIAAVFALRGLKSFRSLSTDIEREMLRSKVAETLINDVGQSLVHGQFKMDREQDGVYLWGSKDRFVFSKAHSLALLGPDLRTLDEYKTECEPSEIRFIGPNVIVFACDISIFNVSENKLNLVSSIPLKNETNDLTPLPKGAGEVSFNGKFAVVLENGKFWFYEIQADGHSSLKATTTVKEAVSTSNRAPRPFIFNDGTTILGTEGMGKLILERDGDVVKSRFKKIDQCIEEVDLEYESVKKIICTAVKDDHKEMYQLGINDGDSPERILVDSQDPNPIWFREKSFEYANFNGAYLNDGGSLVYVELGAGGVTTERVHSKEEKSILEFHALRGTNIFAERTEEGIYVGHRGAKDDLYDYFVPFPISRFLSDNEIVTFGITEQGVAYNLNRYYSLWRGEPLAGKILTRDEDDAFTRDLEYENGCDFKEKFAQSKHYIAKKIPGYLQIESKNADCSSQPVQKYASEFEVKTMSFSSDEQFLFAGSDDLKTQVWRIKPLTLLGQVNSLTFAPDMKLSLRLPGYTDDGARVYANGILDFSIHSRLSIVRPERMIHDYFAIVSDPLALGDEICKSIGDFLRNGLVPSDWDGITESDKHLCD